MLTERDLRVNTKTVYQFGLILHSAANAHPVTSGKNWTPDEGKKVNQVPSAHRLFAAALRAHRIRRDLSLRQLAHLTQVSQSHLANIETGRARIPPTNTRLRIFQGLDLTQSERLVMNELAQLESGNSMTDEGSLPVPVQDLLQELRREGPNLPERFVLGLSIAVREAARAKDPMTLDRREATHTSTKT